MSDASPSTRDFLGSADDELIFDEALPVDIAVPVAVQAETAEPRRVPRRGRKSKDEAASPEPAPAFSPPPPSAEAVTAAAEEPAGAPAPFPPLGADPAGSKSHPLLLAVVGFALLTSTISLGGMITMSRGLAHANADRSEARAERAALASIPSLIAHIDAASAHLDKVAIRSNVAAPVVAPTLAAPEVTMAGLHHEIDALKMSLSHHQPDGLASLNGVTREGFLDLQTRLDRLSGQVEQMQKRGEAPVPRQWTVSKRPS